MNPVPPTPPDQRPRPGRGSRGTTVNSESLYCNSLMSPPGTRQTSAPIWRRGLGQRLVDTAPAAFQHHGQSPTPNPPACCPPPRVRRQSAPNSKTASPTRARLLVALACAFGTPGPRDAPGPVAGPLNPIRLRCGNRAYYWKTMLTIAFAPRRMTGWNVPRSHRSGCPVKFSKFKPVEIEPARNRRLRVRHLRRDRAGESSVPRPRRRMTRCSTRGPP